MKKLNRLFNLILPLFTIAILLIVWLIIAKTYDNEYVVPTIYSTIKELIKLFGEKKFYIALLLTLMRSVISFLMSFLLSFFLAYFANKKQWAERLILPIISITRTIPTLAIAWLILFWTNDKIAPIVVTMLVIFPTSYTQIKGALDSVNKNVIEASKVDGAGWDKVLFKIQLPLIAPDLFNVIGSGLALNLKLMVAAEVLNATIKSLGNMLNLAIPFEVARTISLTIVVLFLGLIVEFLFNKLSKRASVWR